MQHNNNGFGKENVLEHELTEADLAGIYGGVGKGSSLPLKGANSSQDDNSEPDIYDTLMGLPTSVSDFGNFLGN